MLVHNPKHLALAVISQRKSLKLSQSEVGELVGLKQATISAFENKPESTKLDTLFRILSAVELQITTSRKNDKTESQWKEEW